VAIVCAGRRGAPAPEDQVAAGLRVARLAAAVGGEVTVAARRALAVARPYAGHLDRLARDSAWARRLAGQGWQADVRAWLALDRVGLVPVYRPDVDKIVVGSR
jgi:phosphosulfolactate phosphohydrolase-like enzyme